MNISANQAAGRIKKVDGVLFRTRRVNPSLTPALPQRCLTAEAVEGIGRHFDGKIMFEDDDLDQVRDHVLYCEGCANALSRQDSVVIAYLGMKVGEGEPEHVPVSMLDRVF